VNCLGCEWSVSDQDVSQTVTANTIYVLPFGHGKPFLNHGFASRVFDGISLNSIVTARSGLPVNVTLNRQANYIDPVTKQVVIVVPDGNNTDHSSGVSNLRPDLIPGVSLTPQGGRSNLPGGNWINPAAFAIPATGTWGNAPRNLLRGPGLWQADLGTAKKNRFTERINVDFRAEMFNIFNRSQYGAPNFDFTTVASARTALAANPADPTSALTTALNNANAAFTNTTTTVNTGATGSGTPRRIQFGLRINY
jgi:hypothetical protein